ncbi:MAG: GNAT family N-acetyltransferase [Chloroflexota bacterium]|nr:GNAT family N-acetyltransferase [Chloroflexota bacterium]
MIEGTLVNLRARELGDAPASTRWASDEELLRLMGDRYQQSFAATEASVRSYVAKPLSFDEPRFAIETKDGRHIGGMRLFNMSAEDRRARLAILIGEPEYQSRGYGSDALRTFMHFVFEEMNLNRLDLDVFAFNARALATYRKLGFVDEGRRRGAQYSRGAYHDVIIMSMLRDEWLQARDA